MVSVASLLNPLPPSLILEPSSVVPRTYTLPCSPTPSVSPSAVDVKMSNRSAVFVKSTSNGKVKYNPCEFQDEKIAAEHHKFQMMPLDRISEQPRHIPYSSDKKSFQQKTGRDAIDGMKVYEKIEKQRLTTNSIPLYLPYARGYSER